MYESWLYFKDFLWYTALKNLSKCFSRILINYKAAVLDGLLEHYSNSSQEPVYPICSMLWHNKQEKGVYCLCFLFYN